MKITTQPRSYSGRDRAWWRAFYERIKTQVSITQSLNLIGVNTSRLSSRGGKVICPFHKEKIPSMHVYIEEDRVFCFGACYEGFDQIALYAKNEGISYRQAAIRLAKTFGISDEGIAALPAPPPPPPKPKIIKKELPKPLPRTWARIYARAMTDTEKLALSRRWMIPLSAVEAGMLGHTLPFDRDVPAYTIPIWGYRLGENLITIRFRRDDALVPYLDDERKKLAGERKYWGTKGRNGLYPVGLWTLENPQRENWIMLTESERTVYALGHRFPIVTLSGGVKGHSRPGGWPAWSYLIEDFKYWIVAFDDDPAGWESLAVMRQRFPGRVVPFPWPDTTWGGNDLMDFIATFGWEEVLARVDAAIKDFEEKTKWKITKNPWISCSI